MTTASNLPRETDLEQSALQIIESMAGHALAADATETKIPEISERLPLYRAEDLCQRRAGARGASLPLLRLGTPTGRVRLTRWYRITMPK